MEVSQIKYPVNISWISTGVNEVADIFRNNLVTTNTQIEKTARSIF